MFVCKWREDDRNTHSKHRGAVARCGKKKRSLSFSVLINLQRQECVSLVYSPEVLLLGCMYCMFTFGSESFDSPCWQGFQTEHNNQGRCSKKPKYRHINRCTFFYLWLLLKRQGLRVHCVFLTSVELWSSVLFV